MNTDLNTALFNYIMDPKNPQYNFNIGKVYEDMGHTAAAASFYIRTGEYATEFDNNGVLAYEALLRLALCFEHQGSRVFTVKGILLRAISLLPERPEAYYLLARMYEMCKEWQESYTFAVMGEKLKISQYLPSLITNVEYPGAYAFTFERAVTAWWLGLWDESMFLFRKLRKNPNMTWQHINATINNLNNLSGSTIWQSPITYYQSSYEHLKIKFLGSNEIERNYSQCYQDMFVLTMLNGKRDGKFLEIGCAGPYYGNNTALLEKNYEWTGISIDIDQNSINEFSAERASKTICSDASKINYNEILDGDYDYLQLDCDPAIVTYNTLLKIPFETHKFAVITFEHEFYIDEKSNVQEKAQKYLESFGYELVVNNIAPNDHNSYEDWWVHPQLVDKSIIEKMKCISEKPKRADKYMLSEIYR